MYRDALDGLRFKRNVCRPGANVYEERTLVVLPLEGKAEDGPEICNCQINPLLTDPVSTAASACVDTANAKTKMLLSGDGICSTFGISIATH